MALPPGCRANSARLRLAGFIGFPPARLVVPDPPLVWFGLGVAVGRIFPLLLAPECGDVEVSPGAAHRLVAAIVDEVSTEYTLTVADERVRAVPLTDSEVRVEAVRDRVPRDQLPPHACLQALDVLLRRARDERKRGVADVEM